MNAKCCDRCGEFYKSYQMKIHKSGYGYNKLKFTSEDFTYDAIYDLCPNCMYELQKWLKEGPLLAEEYKEEKE